jgi:hypothetical protein
VTLCYSLAPDHTICDTGRAFLSTHPGLRERVALPVEKEQLEASPLPAHLWSYLSVKQPDVVRWMKTIEVAPGRVGLRLRDLDIHLVELSSVKEHFGTVACVIVEGGSGAGPLESVIAPTAPRQASSLTGSGATSGTPLPAVHHAMIPPLLPSAGAAATVPAMATPRPIGVAALAVGKADDAAFSSPAQPRVKSPTLSKGLRDGGVGEVNTPLASRSMTGPQGSSLSTKGPAAMAEGAGPSTPLTARPLRQPAYPLGVATGITTPGGESVPATPATPAASTTPGGGGGGYYVHKLKRPSSLSKP